MLPHVLGFISWDFDPRIYTLAIFGVEWPIAWYGLLFAASFLGGQLVMRYIYKRDRKPVADLEILILYVVLATVIGARLGHYLFYEWELLVAQPGRWLKSMLSLPFEGLASHGAAIAIPAALYLYSRKRSDQPFLWVVDRLVIAVSLGGALIRLGNLLNSEIYGKPTTLPWGFVFVRETDPALLPLVPRHPTQLYESLFCLFLLAVTFALWKQKRYRLPNGFITGIFLILLFSFRFLVEFLKTSQEDFENSMVLNMGQILSIPAILAGVILLLVIRPKNRPVFTANF
ncbi:prolipoprotein diacylglyceryl transferase [Larkinella humicola]|uniref:Phosphatidylglycerol--prolipoprotein diacylglyceryl transferase n=1 Tax=Larkinella humicola TaxID=2607654 RepID=A0A5N1JHI9_9BACT|nr:prolipoprotein diacylglyceryl transferase [Larkinella humicola]KAA9354865.1 prolipoprotein diacylglyceryl transferase [Larkinella humicola]